jgi:hypothetical protein
LERQQSLSPPTGENRTEATEEVAA